MRFALLFLSALLTHAVASETGAPAKVTYLLIYRPGPAWPAGKPVAELPLKDHGNYMLSLFRRGAMKQAGPLTDNAGGAVVLEAADAAEANSIVANDPAVKAGIFVSELHPWAPVDWEKYLKSRAEKKDSAPLREGDRQDGAPKSR